ncbi:HDOD domain-containing protein [Colwellia sp. UCD-KL20]|uniref:HDOD domain-containing protein n=1 Tax=Colwellia sp. UCD-KL20 TaxID=1917165 RepID=UPI0009705D26|nr:HDOD domain-containing protein [Colwellia sp. UCD-KL20]
MLHIDQKVIEDIERGFSIPAQPKLLKKLQGLIAQEEPELNLIARTIAQDAAVSSTILKTINSPVYGLSRTISDIPKSVRYIGLEGIIILVTSSLLKQTFKQEDCSIALEDFWINSTNIANVCVHIGNSLKQAISKDILFSLGLFHDCGIPIMAMKYSEYHQIFQHALETPDVSITSIEDINYQANHATIGYYVATSWRLPKDICQLILAHHERDFLDNPFSRLQKFYFSILKMAENIVHQKRYNEDTPDWTFLKDKVLNILAINEGEYSTLLNSFEEDIA